LVLTPQQEYKLEERLESLLEGGYDIGKKEETWYLVGLPLVQGLLLGEKDLMETLELKSGQQCSRLQRFFASKACRSAVMIGDALTKKQMQEIVRKMGQLDQPWNCPHGRPTMRILHKLEIV
jgi:DNA mismatch repair protein PMS2